MSLWLDAKVLLDSLVLGSSGQPCTGKATSKKVIKVL